MNPHLVVKLRSPVQGIPFPYWANAAQGRAVLPDRFIPEIDRLIDRYGLSTLIASEHHPERNSWNREEIASGLDRLYRIILRNDTDIPQELIEQIRLIPLVEGVRVVEPTSFDMPAPAPGPVQMGIQTDMESRKQIYLPEAHQFTKGDPEIRIAILDTGIDTRHPELSPILETGYDFVNIIDGADTFVGDFLGADLDPQDDVGHGTHIAGIIGAQGKAVPTGVAPRCRIIPVRVLAAMKQGDRRIGAGLVENIDAGVKWAVDQGADVINMSLGVRQSQGGLPHQEVIDYANRKGVTVVAASGNDGTDESYYPGAFKSVITVGAWDSRQSEVASFSTWGRQVSFVAPGTDIYSTHIDGGYAFSSGTSHAAPFVAGAVALLKSFAKSTGHRLTDSQVKHVLKHTSDKTGKVFKDMHSGYGLVNIRDALKFTRYKLMNQGS